MAADWKTIGDGPSGGAMGDMSWINDGFGCRRKRAKEQDLAMAGGKRGWGRKKGGSGRGKPSWEEDRPPQARGHPPHANVGPQGARGLGQLMGDLRGDDGQRSMEPPEWVRERDRERDRGRGHEQERRGWHGDPRDGEPPLVSMSWPPTEEEEPMRRPTGGKGYERGGFHNLSRRGRGGFHDDKRRERGSFHDDEWTERGGFHDDERREMGDRIHHKSPEREDRGRRRNDRREEPPEWKLEPWETLMPESWEDKQKEFFCTLCNVQTGSAKNVEKHCMGRMHRMRAKLFPEDDPWRKKETECGHQDDHHHHEEGDGQYEDDWGEEYWEEEELSLEERMKQFYCTLCEVQTTGDENLEMHLKGMRHTANEERQKRGENVIKGSRNKGNRKKKKINVDGSDVVDIQTVINKCPEPLVGLENVVEYFRQEWQTEANFYCQMCETKFQQVNFIPHVTGYRHRYNYIKIKRPEMKEQCRAEAKGKETPIEVDGEVIVEKTPKRNRTDVLNILRKVCKEILDQEGQQKLQKGPDPNPPEIPINRLKKTMRSDSQLPLKSLDPSEFKMPVTVPAPIPLGGGVRRPTSRQEPNEGKSDESKEGKSEESKRRAPPMSPQPRPHIYGYQPPDVPPPGMMSVPSDLPPDAPPPTSMMMKPGARPLFPTGMRPLGPPMQPMMATMGAPMPVHGMRMGPRPVPPPPRAPLLRPEDRTPSMPAPKPLHEIKKELKQEVEREFQRRRRDPYLDRLKSERPINSLGEKARSQQREADPFLAPYLERSHPLPLEREREREREYRYPVDRDRRHSPDRDRGRSSFGRERFRSPERERRRSLERERRRSLDRERRRSPGRDRGRRHRDSPPRDRSRTPAQGERYDPILERPRISQELKDLYSKDRSSSSSSRSFINRSKSSSSKSINNLSDEELKRAFEERFGEKKSTSSNVIEDVVGEISKTLVQRGEDASMALRVSSALTKALLSIDKKQKGVLESEGEEGPCPLPPGSCDPSHPAQDFPARPQPIGPPQTIGPPRQQTVPPQNMDLAYPTMYMQQQQAGAMYATQYGAQQQQAGAMYATQYGAQPFPASYGQPLQGQFMGAPQVPWAPEQYWQRQLQLQAAPAEEKKPSSPPPPPAEDMTGGEFSF